MVQQWLPCCALLFKQGTEASVCVRAHAETKYIWAGPYQIINKLVLTLSQHFFNLNVLFIAAILSYLPGSSQEAHQGLPFLYSLPLFFLFCFVFSMNLSPDKGGILPALE